MSEDAFEALLAGLPGMPLEQLRSVWSAQLGTAAPTRSTSLLRLGLAHELQVQRYGGLPARTERRLRDLVAGRTPSLSVRPGLRLAREWGGKVHVVTVEEDGSILWNEKQWNSLSAVARAITGTRWSGPAFFGLTRKSSAA